MKHNIIFCFLLAFAATVFGQSTDPRWLGDNSGRSISFKKISKTDATGADTVKVYPNASCNYVHATINDSLVFNLTPVTGSFQGDEITFSFTNTSGSGHKVEFLTTNVELESAGKLTLIASKRCLIRFFFNGVKWVEMWRMIQA